MASVGGRLHRGRLQRNHAAAGRLLDLLLLGEAARRSAPLSTDPEVARRQEFLSTVGCGYARAHEERGD